MANGAEIAACKQRMIDAYLDKQKFADIKDMHVCQ